MTPAQIAEAQKLSRVLWKKYVVPFRKEFQPASLA
jgi:hypothetical protein